MDTLLAINFHIDFIVKCVIALILGGIIGIERELKNKPAGLKTHVLICVGATVLTFLSGRFSVTGDPGRIAAQIISGIGFIGAGTILHSRQVVQGLTTAATLWVVASIGMLVGADFYIPAVAITLLVFVFLVLLNSLFVFRYDRQKYCLSLEVLKLESMEKIEDMISKFDLEVEEKNLVRTDKIHLELHYYTAPLNQHIFIKRLFQLQGLGRIIQI